MPFVTTTVFAASVAVKLPACPPEGLLASRAVSWNDHALCEMSFTVTDRCCLTPGVYVVPDGKVTDAVPVVEIPL